MPCWSLYLYFFILSFVIYDQLAEYPAFACSSHGNGLPQRALAGGMWPAGNRVYLKWVCFQSLRSDPEWVLLWSVFILCGLMLWWNVWLRWVQLNYFFLHWLLPNTLNQFSVDRGQKCDGFLLSLTFDPPLSHISPDPRRCFLLFALLSSPSAAEPWETRPCWLMCNHLKGFPLCSAAWLISCASAEGRRVFTHAGRLRASPGGPAEGSFHPNGLKVLFPLIGLGSFGCHLRKSSNLSRET